MIILTVNEIITLHMKLIKATGGSDGLRDRTLLESAVMNCYQTFSGEELYPGVIEKAARLAFGICANHPFIDGNKRVAVTAMLVILRLNNISIRFSQKELIELGLAIADGSFVYEDVTEWIREHLSIR